MYPIFNQCIVGKLHGQVEFTLSQDPIVKMTRKGSMMILPTMRRSALRRATRGHKHRMAMWDSSCMIAADPLKARKMNEYWARSSRPGRGSFRKTRNTSS